MLDATPYDDTIATSWQETVTRGDLVSFVFPCQEDHPTEPAKARPCLILEMEQCSGLRFAQVVYGTTSMSVATRAMRSGSSRKKIIDSPVCTNPRDTSARPPSACR